MLSNDRLEILKGIVILEGKNEQTKHAKTRAFLKDSVFSSFKGHYERGEKSCPLKTLPRMLGLQQKKMELSNSNYSGRNFKLHSER